MARQVFSYRPVERFVTGTVGPPGQREFFLQAAAHRMLTTVAVEKQQVSVLARRMGELLDEVSRREGDEAGIPAISSIVDMAPLSTPIESEFTVGTMSLAWESATRLVAIECFSTDDAPEGAGSEELNDEDDEAQGSVLRVWLTADQARHFAQRSAAVVQAGRPPCPICEEPLDPEGHICPRANGYRR